MKRNFVCLSLSILLFALSFPVEAQQAMKVYRIGYLSTSNLSARPATLGAFRQGLRNLGYVEGKNLNIEYASTEKSLAARATEFARLKVDVIVTSGATATRAAKEATMTIPIVMLQDPDPVGNGFVTSLARPGGNITGFSSLIADLSGKRLELLKEILPKLSRVAVLGNSANTGNATQLKETERAAGELGMQLQYLDMLRPKDIETVFREAIKERADAVFVLRGPPVISSQPTLLAQLAVKSHLPATYPQSGYVEAGGLMSYGVSVADLERRAAVYVDKILKGATPADLPIEQPKKFEFVINLKAAKQIGLTIPPSVLVRADRVIR
ncbi:MAG: ABC transporter substrate-binding protein [Alphaproteobacteria bacterium]